MRRSLVTLAWLFCAPPLALADEEAALVVPAPPGFLAPRLADLALGEPAPFAGMLLDGDTYQAYLALQPALERERDARSREREEFARTVQAALTVQAGGYRLTWGFWVGLAVGGLVTLGVVYLLARAVDAMPGT